MALLMGRQIYDANREGLFIFTRLRLVSLEACVIKHMLSQAIMTSRKRYPDRPT